MISLQSFSLSLCLVLLLASILLNLQFAAHLAALEQPPAHVDQQHIARVAQRTEQALRASASLLKSLDSVRDRLAQLEAAPGATVAASAPVDSVNADGDDSDALARASAIIERNSRQLAKLSAVLHQQQDRRSATTTSTCKTTAGATPGSAHSTAPPSTRNSTALRSVGLAVGARERFPADTRFLSDFGHQGAYTDYADKVDEFARSSSQLIEQQHVVTSNIVIDTQAKNAELDESNPLAAVPDIDDLLRAPAWLSNRSSACATCDVKQRVAESPLQPHYQSIMERLDHLPPHTMARQFFQVLLPQQFPRDCSRARLLLYTHWSDLGLGSELHWLEVAFTAAFLTNRTLVVLEQDGWLWAERRLCGRRTLSCYFEPLSSCQALSDDSLRALLAPQRRESVPLLDPALLGDEWHRDVRVVAWRSDGGLARTVPDQFRYLWPRSVFWWRAHLMRWIFRPRHYITTWIASRRAAAIAPATTRARASVHFRSGDKTHGNSLQAVEMKGTGVDAAVERLRQLHALCPFDSVFVSTRDPSVVAALDERAKELPFSVTFDRAQLRYGNGFHTLDLVTGRLNATEEALQYIKDVLLLVDAELLIGFFESNLSRLVAELGAAHDRFRCGAPVALGDGGYIVWP